MVLKNVMYFIIEIIILVQLFLLLFITVRQRINSTLFPGIIKYIVSNSFTMLTFDVSEKLIFCTNLRQLQSHAILKSVNFL